MEAVLTGIVLLALFVGIVATMPFAYAGWRRLTARENDLQIWRAMRRRGLAPEDAVGEEAKLARAVRRCVLCPSIEDCDHWLASGNKDGLGLFCPNATLFDDLQLAKEERKR